MAQRENWQFWFFGVSMSVSIIRRYLSVCNTCVYITLWFFLYSCQCSQKHVNNVRAFPCQWGRSNRPRIRPGTEKSLNAPWELSELALSRDYAKKIDPCRMLVWLGRRTVQNMYHRIGSVHWYLISLYKLGRSCSNSNLLRPRVPQMCFRSCSSSIYAEFYFCLITIM